MKSGFFSKAPHRRAISAVLLAAFLSLLLFPFHYHLHHAEHTVADGAAAVGHIIDLHGSQDLSGDDHHQDGHTIEPATDLALKSSSVPPPLAILFLTLLLILPASTRVVRLSFMRTDARPPTPHWHNTPPLRAPPAH